MEVRIVSKIAWLSLAMQNTSLYASKVLNYRQLLPIITFLLFFNFTTYASSELPKENYQLSTIVTELNSPWSMVQLPDKTWLITERDGHIVVVQNKQKTRIKLDLKGLYVAGQGGLLDITLSPDFAESNEVILTYAQGSLKANRLVIAKAKFEGNDFSNIHPIYTVKTDKGTPQHYAGRVLVLPDNTLLFSSGDGFDYREQAQVITSQLGKILRVKLDGTMPKDNPFILNEHLHAHAVYTYGHRNPQGLVYDYDRQQIVSHEHGPAGGDELNYLNAGTNYGWPVITYGKDYSQARISPFTEYKGMEQPNVNWTPSIAPSGMVYYGSEQVSFPSLQQHVLITTLADQKLYAINLADGKFTQTHIFSEFNERLRDVFLTKEGNIAVLTDGINAKLQLLHPNKVD